MSDHEDEGAPQPMELEGDSNAEQQQQEQHEEEHDDAGAEGESKENGGDEAVGGDSTVTPLKRPMSAYFLFLADARPGVIATLDAESQAEAEAAGAAPGEPFKSKSKNVALVGKMLGDKWKAMTDEEKEVSAGTAGRGLRLAARACAAGSFDPCAHSPGPDSPPLVVRCSTSPPPLSPSSLAARS